jgi:hypothetical protein
MDFMCLYPGKILEIFIFPNSALHVTQAHLSLFFLYTRLGLKGPVYLKDKDGKSIVPASLISGKNSNGK